jgi:sugar lactone lactonase YvrE
MLKLGRRTRTVVLGSTVALLAALPATTSLTGMHMAVPHSLFAGFANRTIAPVTAANGDANPYSIAVVPQTAGSLTQGNVLVVDFNNSKGMSGAGMSIVQVDPTTGTSSTFYSNPSITGPVGIAINASNDIVWVAYWGTAANGSGSGYAVISPTGQLLANFTNQTASFNGMHNLFEGSWGAAFAPGAFFWTNVNASNSGRDGQVWRLNPNPTGRHNGQPLNSTYTPLVTNLPTNSAVQGGENPSNAAGPQGMVYDPRNGILYVADDANNTIYAIPNALTATGPVTPIVVSSGGALHAPQNLALDPENGDLLVVNGAINNDIVEISTYSNRQLALRPLRAGAPGALFGLAATKNARNQLVVYYDDANNATLRALMPRH